MAEPNTVKWEKEGHLGILSFNNPPENYLVNPEFVSVTQLMEWLSNDIRALIITGVGRHFSAGADLENLLPQSAPPEGLIQVMTQGNYLLNFIDGLEIPVLAAISGVCFGGGLEVALACDIRICTKRAMFAFPEINHDLIPGLGGLKRLQNLCGHKTAMEILFSGDFINASKAFELKIVDQIIPSKDILDYSRQFMLGLIKGRSPKVIRMLMRSFRNADLLDRDKAMKIDVEMFCELAHDFSLKI
jgi:enoyl-CoA hydratase/carnithine racemase